MFASKKKVGFFFRLVILRKQCGIHLKYKGFIQTHMEMTMTVIKYLGMKIEHGFDIR